MTTYDLPALYISGVWCLKRDNHKAKRAKEDTPEAAARKGVSSVTRNKTRYQTKNKPESYILHFRLQTFHVRPL